MDGADGDHARLQRVQPAAHHLLHRVDDQPGQRDGIDGRLGPRGVAARADDLQVEHVGRGHHGAGAGGHVTHVQCRVHVQAEDRVQSVQRALFHHAHAARLVLAVLGFFAGLEEQAHTAGQASLVGQFLENGGRAQQDGGVRIVAARVHDARARAVELGAVHFLDGQRVHVGAQPHDRAVPAFDVADHAGLGHLGLGGHAQVDERGVDQRRGTVLVKGQLGVAVNRAPPSADLLLDGLSTLEDLLTGNGLGHGFLSSAMAQPLAGGASFWCRRARPCHMRAGENIILAPNMATNRLRQATGKPSYKFRMAGRSKRNRRSVPTDAG